MATLSVTMLGAGQEVGRSCCVLKYKGITVVCDTGIHPAHSGMASLPFIDAFDWSTVDAILITHFHLDHIGALTYIMEKTNFKDGKGRVYMTQPTKAIYKLIMRDFVRMSETFTEPLFTSRDLANSLLDIIPVSIHQLVSPRPNLSFTPYNAGHVIGACMYMIEISDIKILYTGDYSREETQLLPKAEIPPFKPDVLIVESTHGVQMLDKRESKEKKLTDLVYRIIQRGGHVLLPVFALGQAQELMLVLDAYWKAHPKLHSTPIYYASEMAHKSLAVYQTYMHTLNATVWRRFSERDNPFVLRHVTYLSQNRESVEMAAYGPPCVILATPGMLQSGMSRELLEMWAPDVRNGVIITGYSTEGTLAREIIRKVPEELPSLHLDARSIPCRISIDEIAFSGHVDFTDNMEFIEQLHASHIVLVHGERYGMSRLKDALKSNFVSCNENVEVYMPRNLEPLLLNFDTKRKLTKVIGKLGSADVTNNAILSGLLVQNEYSSILYDQQDLSHLGEISTASISQKQKLALEIPWPMIVQQLESTFGADETLVNSEGTSILRVMKVLEVQRTGSFELTLEWVSTPLNDMIADAVIAFLLNVQGSRASINSFCQHHMPPTDLMDAGNSEGHLERLQMFFQAHFGNVEIHQRGSSISDMRVTVNGTNIYVDLKTLTIVCSDDILRKRAYEVLELAMISSYSLQDVFPT